MRRIVWRCLIRCSYEPRGCTTRCDHQPEVCIHPSIGQKAVWQRYEGRTGQRHFDDVGEVGEL